MADIGFVGLGTMGSAMATRLLDTGHTVRVWNRSAAAVDRLVEAGADRAESLEEALASGIVLSMLAGDASVEETFTRELLTAAPTGAIHVNHATISTAAAARLTRLHGDAGVEYVAAPILGRASLAATGAVNIVAAGSAPAIDRIRPLLTDLGRRLWIVGDEPDQASLVKIGVNYNLIHALQAIAESVTLMEHGGIDASTFVEILTDVAFTGSVYTGYGRMIAERLYSPPGFTIGLGAKDLSLAEDAASSLGVALASAPVLRDVFVRALEDPSMADLDWSAIAEVTRRASGASA
jgi:3-hydroxyisobutyrate dehydrogenase-like beta-hydroxyacid dehydrogenase